MIIQKFELKKYNWRVVVLYEVTSEHLQYVLKILDEMKADYEVKDVAAKNISADKLNTGFIYSNYENKQSIIVIGRASSQGEFFNTVTHEANHLESHIARVFGFDQSGEEACELIGYVVQRMSAVFRKILCK